MMGMGIGMAEIIVIVVVLLAVVVYVRSRQQSAEADDLSEVEIDWDAANHLSVQTKLQVGHKIKAITVYRQLTGVDLKTAKRAIEYLLAHPEARGRKKGRQPDDSAAGLRDLVREGRIDEAAELYRQFAGVDQYTAEDAIAEIVREVRLEDGDTDPVRDPRVLELLENGQKIGAIKVYRELTGASLKTAKEAVEVVEDEMRRL